MLPFLHQFRYRAELPFALFLHTLAFVTFNKVCTAQYFVWYTSLLPLVLPQSRLLLGRNRWRGVAMVAVWFVTELHWLLQAYRLEILGENTFFAVWLASCTFFAANVWILVEIVVHHREVPVFRAGKLVDLAAALSPNGSKKVK